MAILNSHIRTVPLPQAQKLIMPVNQFFSEALGDLAPVQRRISRRTGAGQDLYVVDYAYGQLLAGSYTPTDHLGGFLPPCGNRIDACDRCKELVANLGNERPLCIVLTHVVEEFLEVRAEHFVDKHSIRFSPSRLVSSAGYVNLKEVLNSIIDPEFPKGAFKAPVRNASAGIRSAYLTAPVGNKDLKSALKKSWMSTRKKEPDLEWWKADWDDRDFLKAASEIGLAKMQSSWGVQAIVIPISWLRSALYSRGMFRNDGKNLLLHLLAAGWKESRGLRSTSIRQLTLSEAGRNVPGRTTAEHIVSRLLLILRGDAPGFRPAVLNDESFPMTAIWLTLIGDEQIQKQFFEDRFPGIIEPFHLNRRMNMPSGTFFYYPLTSFEQLGYAGDPVDELDTIEAVDKLLRTLQDKNPEMLGQIKWDFFASPAPLESNLTKTRSLARRTRNNLVPFTSAELSDVIHKDFEPQLRAASNFGPVPTRILSKPPRKGFLRRFIRVTVS